jgi:hypothetical protein
MQFFALLTAALWLLQAAGVVHCGRTLLAAEAEAGSSSSQQQQQPHSAIGGQPAAGSTGRWLLLHVDARTFYCFFG